MKKVPAEHHDYLKYQYDGIETLAGLADALRATADHYESLARQDARLTEPVDGGRVQYVVPGHEVSVESPEEEDEEEDWDQDRTCTECYETTDTVCRPKSGL